MLWAATGAPRVSFLGDLGGSWNGDLILPHLARSRLPVIPLLFPFFALSNFVHSGQIFLHAVTRRHTVQCGTIESTTRPHLGLEPWIEGALLQAFEFLHVTSLFELLALAL